MSAQLPIIIVVAAMTLFQLSPQISALFAKLFNRKASAVAAKGGDSPISRDEAVAGLMLAVDYAHQAGNHDVCDGLGAFLPGLIKHAGAPT